MQYGCTALIWAVWHGDVNVVQYLVEVGANLEAVEIKVSGHVVWHHVDV